MILLNSLRIDRPLSKYLTGPFSHYLPLQALTLSGPISLKDTVFVFFFFFPIAVSVVEPLNTWNPSEKYSFTTEQYHLSLLSYFD